MLFRWYAQSKSEQNAPVIEIQIILACASWQGGMRGTAEDETVVYCISCEACIEACVNRDNVLDGCL